MGCQFKLLFLFAKYCLDNYT